MDAAGSQNNQVFFSVVAADPHLPGRRSISFQQRVGFLHCRAAGQSWMAARRRCGALPGGSWTTLLLATLNLPRQCYFIIPLVLWKVPSLRSVFLITLIVSILSAGKKKKRLGSISELRSSQSRIFFPQ